MTAAYCINPNCSHPQNRENDLVCAQCGTPLLVGVGEHYRVLRPLQPRSFNTSTALFEVTDDRTQEIKVLKILRYPSPNKVVRLEQEYNVLSLLDAPGRIPLADLDGFFSVMLGDNHTIPCFVMEKMVGQPLNLWLEEGNRLTASEAVDWLRQLIQLIAIVHQSLYFHRDIKPDNLILQPNGTLALVDFGACRRLTETYLVKLRFGENQAQYRGSATSLYTMTAVGSAGYSPIEQIHGRSVPQSDFFAIGRTLVHLLTGHHPMQMPVDALGRLQWAGYAPHLPQPLIDLIDDLQNPAWQQRPVSTHLILDRLDLLPRQIRLYGLRQSGQFKIALALSGVLLAGLSLWGIRAAVEYQKASTVRQSIELGTQSQLRGDFATARRNYEAALKLQPNLPEVYQNLALICQLERNIDCATANYNQAIKLDPNRWQIYYNLGSLYDAQGDDFYRQYLNRKNGLDLSKPVHQELEDKILQSYEQSEKYYKLALDKSNNSAIDAANNLVRVLILQNKYNNGIKIAVESLPYAIDQVSRGALTKNLGWAKLGQSRFTEALAYLQTAQNLNPQRADVQCLLAQAHEYLSNHQAAKQAWKRCLLYEGNSPEVFQWRQQYINRLIL